MITKFLILLAITMSISIAPAFGEHKDQLQNQLGLGDYQWHSECLLLEGYALEGCVYSLFNSYTSLIDQYHTLHHNHTINIRTVEHLQDEVNVWHNKYNYLLAQQGNQTIQDKVANLTARVDAVETKASTNESLIYIIQNMLRTVQTDIEDIYLKINSVR